LASLINGNDFMTHLTGARQMTALVWS